MNIPKFVRTGGEFFSPSILNNVSSLKMIGLKAY